MAVSMSLGHVAPRREGAREYRRTYAYEHERRAPPPRSAQPGDGQGGESQWDELEPCSQSEDGRRNGRSSPSGERKQEGEHEETSVVPVETVMRTVGKVNHAIAARRPALWAVGADDDSGALNRHRPTTTAIAMAAATVTASVASASDQASRTGVNAAKGT